MVHDWFKSYKFCFSWTGGLVKLWVLHEQCSSQINRIFSPWMGSRRFPAQTSWGRNAVSLTLLDHWSKWSFTFLWRHLSWPSISLYLPDAHNWWALNLDLRMEQVDSVLRHTSWLPQILCVHNIFFFSMKIRPAWDTIFAALLLPRRVQRLLAVPQYDFWTRSGHHHSMLHSNSFDMCVLEAGG